MSGQSGERNSPAGLMMDADTTLTTGFGIRSSAFGQRAEVRSRFPKNERRAPSSRLISRSLLLVALLIMHTSVVRATGKSYSKQAADLVLNVDSRWAGCGHGGYYPVRIRVTNRGLERDLTFRFSSVDQGLGALPTVRRSIRVALNSTARLTLSIPCVGEGSYGTLDVYQDGRLIKALSETLSLPDNLGHSTPRPALLIISPTNVDAEYFESAVTSMDSAAAASASSAYGYGGYGAIGEDHQVAGPETLPDSWIDYTGLDLVAVSLKTLAALRVEERTALLHWVHCGGNLIVSEVGEPVGQSRELARLLELNQHAALGSAWEPANPGNRRKINIVELDAGNLVTEAEATTKVEEVAEDASASVPADEAGDATADFVWPASSEAFARRRLMMGYVYAFREDPFDGTAHDWAWFLKSMPAQSRTWTERHGMAARRGSDEFLKFLIPSVKGVPVLAFVLLITMFTFAIGPLNYLWLWKKRRLYLLVLTIPAIALATSCALFAYSAVAHGFSTKSRARTLTLLDQKSNTAVAMSRVALFAGLAPAGGLKFSPETAIFPIWPENTAFETGTVDWTDRQTLSGWLKSRTRTQFLIVSHRDERGRLSVSSPVGGKMRVENGLEWGLDALVVADETGALFSGTGIAAGASVELTPLTDEQRKAFDDLLKQFPLVPPASDGNSGIFSNWGFDMSYMYGGSTPVHYETSLHEQSIRGLGRLGSSSEGLEPNSYAAILSENPGIEFGIEDATPQVSLHVLIGRY